MVAVVPLDVALDTWASRVSTSFNRALTTLVLPLLYTATSNASVSAEITALKPPVMSVQVAPRSSLRKRPPEAPVKET